jgi:hypothetical protein
MNDCIERDIQEMLPDLLHGTLGGDARARVEAHLAGCVECSEDLEVLRTVKAAAVFAPSIDVDRVVRQIPPYTPIVPAVERPARARVVSWLVAASLALVVASGGSLLLQQRVNLPRSIQRGAAALKVAQGGGSAPKTPSRVTPTSPGPAVAPRPHALALANDVEGLSDGDLRQLMSDMGRFDALPAPEPEPVISVDTGDGLGQDTR